MPHRDKLIQKLSKIISQNQTICAIPQKRFSTNSNDTSSNRSLNKDYLAFIDRYNPYNFPEIYISLMKLTYVFPPKVIDMLIDAFRSNITPYITELISGCFVTDTTDPLNPVTVCNNELLLCQVPECDRDFYEKFIQTDTWEYFCDKLSKPITEFKKSLSSEFHDLHESETDKTDHENEINNNDKTANTNENTTITTNTDTNNNDNSNTNTNNENSNQSLN